MFGLWFRQAHRTRSSVFVILFSFLISGIIPSTLFSGSLPLLKQLLPVSTAFAADDPSLVFTSAIGGGLTQIESGATFEYILSYTCAGIANNCTSVQITDTLPSGVEFVDLVKTIDVVSFNYNSGTNTVTIDFGAILPAGRTGILKIVARYKPGTLPGGSTNNTATISATNATSVTTPPVSVTITTPEFEMFAQKTLATSEVVAGFPATFNLQLCSPDSTGGVNGTNVFFEDALPDEATFVTADGTEGVDWVYYPVTHTVSFIQPLTATVGPCLTRQVTVIHDALPTNPQINNLTIKVTPEGCSGGSLPDYCEGQTERTLGPVGLTYTNDIIEPYAEGNAGKSSTSRSSFQDADEPTRPTEALPGETVTYTVAANNSGYVTLMTATITDTMPTTLDFQAMTFAPYITTTTINGSYQVNGGAFQPLPGGPFSTSTTLNRAALGLNVGDNLTAVRWDLGDLPPQTGWSAQVVANLDNTVVPPATVQNCVDFSGLPSNGDPIILSNSCNTVRSIQQRAIPRLTKSSGADTYLPTQEFDYVVRLRNDQAAHLNVQNPVIADIIPSQFEYITGTASFESAISATGAPTPTIEELPNFDGGGSYVLRWSWTGGTAYNLPRGQELVVKYRVRVKDDTAPGTYLNKAIMSSGSSPNTLSCSGSSNVYSDTLDLDADTNTSETFCQNPDSGGQGVVGVQLSMASEKFVKGSLDSEFQKLGMTFPGGDVDWKMVLTNTSNVSVTNIVVVDVLPYIGDKGVIVDNLRKSMWRPNFQTAVTFSGSYPLTIFYSQSKNPCRSEVVAGGPSGCVNDWSTTVPEDETSIQAIKLQFCSGSNCLVIPRNASIEVAWHMVAPADMPTDISCTNSYSATNWIRYETDYPSCQIAWNSFGFTAQEYKPSGDGLQLLPAEPLKVGIRGAPSLSNTYSIGDLVWLDVAGLQNDGIQQSIEQTNWGVNGVRVELYDIDYQLLNTQFTGPNHLGQPGYYRFPNLAEGTYLLRFYPPAGYEISPQQLGSGSQDPNDSDGDSFSSDPILGEYYETEIFTLDDTTTDANKHDPTWDFGMWLETDYGDAPISYPVQASGAISPELAGRHIILPGFMLGAIEDAELDGQPNESIGDDSGAQDDEDGVQFRYFTGTGAQPTAILFIGEDNNVTITATVPATVTTPAYLTAWVDFNTNGQWDSGEQAVVDQMVNGVATATINVPANATLGLTNARFRLSTESGLLATGTAKDGEVEDYKVQIVRRDRADAPNSYSTDNASNGPSHIITDTLNLGAIVDAESDGQPVTAGDPATDDDNNGPGADDEDGIRFLSPIRPGSVVTVEVIVMNSGAPAYLNGWLDFDDNGNFNQSSNHIFAGLAVISGTQQFTFTVPVDAAQDITTYSRFRLSTEPNLNYDELAWDGEVEDYEVYIEPLGSIGDRIWYDANGDGGDAGNGSGEEGFGGIAVILTQPDGSQITTTTTITGYYKFDNLPMGTYTVTVVTSTLPITVNHTPTFDPNGGANSTSVVTLIASNKHRLDQDFGYRPERVAIGNIVWIDNGQGGGTADNGKLDGDEAVLDGVEVELYLATQTPGVDMPLSTTTTAGGGYYQFDYLAPDQYIVHIPARNFAANAVLDHYLSSTGAGNDETSNEADDENGSDNSDPASNGISSQAYTLVLNSEMSGEDQVNYVGMLDDNDVNFTADFSFVAYDRGDLPDAPYATLLTNNGAHHVVTPDLYFGADVDAESDGQPDLHTGLGSNPAGDDQDGNDDEDGIVFMTPLMPGTTATISITAHVSPSIGSANYGAFIDFNGDGIFGAGEIFTGTLNTGETALNLTVPAVVSDTIYARFRIAVAANEVNLLIGKALSGEVEDYVLMSLGNTVWFDNGVGNGTADNGILDGTEVGIDGVTVELYLAGQTPGVSSPIATTTTDSNGHYRFSGLSEADYIVHLPASNFGANQPLENRFSSSSDSSDDNDEDDNENGVDDPDPASNGISADSITLSVGDEPTADGNDDLSNLTVDFGLIEYDLGDLPDSSTFINSPIYNTNLNDDGPMHLIVSGLGIGADEDAEVDGQADADATGDDNSNRDDEDGVTFPEIIAGHTATVTVGVTNTRGVTATLYGFIDFNGDGNFDDAGESQTAVIPGDGSVTSVALAFAVPLGADDTQWLGARFRISSNDMLAADGGIPDLGTADGEVEDYLIEVNRYDLGDLPEDSGDNYATLLANNGPAHLILPFENPMLGVSEDNESDGQPTTAANGDDNAASDDEDGVTLPEMTPGQTVTVTVSYSNPTAGNVFLNAWLDVDGNGTLEQVADSQALTPGTGVVSILVNVPLTATRGIGYARFRISSEPNLAQTGTAPDGEVEDYVFPIGPVDYGDLPLIYTTLRADDGARHAIDDETYLGNEVDDDPNGMPSADADGDDGSDENDDEDGVVWLEPLLPGSTVNISVAASGSGYLNAWIDFNGDGDFNDLAERIVLTDTLLNTGDQSLSIVVPDFVTTTLYSRFRFSASQNEATTPSGLALSGEVEDYVLYALGNTVWLDNGIGGGIANDGALNGGEAGIADAIIELYLDGDEPGLDLPIATTTTDGNGHYLFTGLDDADYFVYIPAENFQLSSDPLFELQSSTGAADDDADEDVNENGIDESDPDLFGILSNVVRPRINAGEANLTIDFGLISYDYGDLPDFGRDGGPYPTNLINDGPRHIVSPELYFGWLVDAEMDGAPDANTGLGSNPDGDDQEDSNDDEDGIVFISTMQPNGTAEIEINAYVEPGMTAYYGAFIDFDGDGSFAAGEIFTGTINDGLSSLALPVPAFVADAVYARFRIAFDLAEVSQPDGEALSGEVEDYVLLSLGNQLWFDNDPNAKDGVFDSGETPVPAGITVTLVLSGTNTPVASTTTDANGQYFFTGVSAGDYQVVIDAENFQPGGLLEGYLSTETNENDPNVDGDDNDNGIDAASPASDGIASNAVTLLPGSEPASNGMSNPTVDFGFIAFDWGDLPDGNASNSASYVTLAANTGPSHRIVPGLTMGSVVDGEIDGQPSATATGDDVNGMSNDDEDGVQLPSRFVAGVSTTITVSVVNTTGETATVYARIDWNGDGDFNDNEESKTGDIVGSGDLNFTFAVPEDANTAQLLGARFRLSTNPELGENAAAHNGEIEDYLVPVVTFDFGDLPTGFPTLLNEDGARHVIDPDANPIMGSIVDDEVDGAPSTLANGDDLAGQMDDEDGVTIPALIPGEMVTVTVNYNNPTTGTVALNAWLDIDGDGDLDQIANNVAVPMGAGTLNLPVAVPVNALPGNVYARFRISTEQNLAITGEAVNGEVEDYRVVIASLDYGDLPTGYPTLHGENGPRHILIGELNPVLGQQVDDERDGLHSSAADGDDTQGLNDDEDGVTIPALIPGTTVTVTVSYDNPYEGSVYLNGWIDIDGDGDLDQITTDRLLTIGNGVVEIAVNVPANALPGDVAARFRISSQPGLQPTGLARDGEVEDYIVAILPLDYGDLPDASQGGSDPTTFAADGARHVIGGIFLGASVDNERNGQPSVNANGDDLNPAIADDEDGVRFVTPIMPGQLFTIEVTSSAAGFLNAWIDFNGNSVLEAGEQISSDQALAASVNTLSFTAPLTVSDTLYSRFRVTTAAGEVSTTTGLAQSGEVEDYVLLSLGNTVWADTGAGVTNNGIQDAGEAGVAGVRVELYRADQVAGVDVPLATTTTDANGNYLFTGLMAGDYVVSIPDSEFATGEPLANHASSSDGKNGVGLDADNDSDDGDDNGVDASAVAERVSSEPVTLSLGGEPTNDGNGVNSNRGVDFGFFVPVSLGNLVWNDINNNGLVDTGEIGIVGVELQLFREGDNPITATPVATDTTDASGNYLFEGLEPGKYFVYVPSAPPQYPASSTVTDSADNGEDNDDNGTQVSFGTPVRSPVIELIVSDEPTTDGDNANGDLTVDFGFFRPATLGNLVWDDKNNNGVQDPDEPGVPNVTINLYDDKDNLLGTKVTDINGNYLFTDIVPGRYVVEFVAPPEYHLTTGVQGGNDQQDSDADAGGHTNVIVIQGGSVILGIDAGLVRIPTGSDDEDEPGAIKRVYLPVVSR